MKSTTTSKGRLCGGGAEPALSGAEEPRPTLTLSRRIAEIDGDHGLSGGGVAVETVGLEPPLLDRGHPRPARNKISTKKVQILYGPLPPNTALDHNRCVNVLR